MKTIGVALGAGRMVAALPGGHTLDATSVGDLTAAFAELQQAVGGTRIRVHVALVPPLVDVRRVQLPPLRHEERRQVLTRDAGRYFLGAREPLVVGVAPDLPVIAAAAASLVDELERAVAAAGWSLGSIVPAHVAWIHAARTSSQPHVIVKLADGIEAIRVDRGRFVERRRLRLTDELPPGTEIEPFTSAATSAPHVRALEFCSAVRLSDRRRIARRVTAALTAAAAACLLLSAGVDYWGLRHELAAIRARRAAIAPRVERAMHLRDSVATLTTVVSALDDREVTRPSWPALLADLADNVPADAYLAALRAKGDSLMIIGTGRDAAAVLHGVERITWLSSVRADGPIQQEVTPGGDIREHFRFAARWSP